MGSARYPQSARPSRGTRPSRGAQPARRTRPSRRTRPPLPLVGALALVAIVAVALLVATACDRTPGPHIAHDGPAGPVALSAQAAQDRVGAYGHDIIELTAQGGDFSHAAQVMFEVRNTSDPKAEPLWLDAVKRGSSWTAEVDPAISGVGDYRIVAHGSDGDGDSFYAELDHTCTIAFEPADEVHLVGGDYDVAYGMAGLKVLHIQQVFGNGVDNYPRYLDDTERRVREFQERHGLPATGVVDRETWLALGLDPMEWYTLGAYVSPATVGENPTDEQRVDAMIARARDYLGDTYIWDAAGKPGQGIDCAGLVIQGLYAAGMDPGILNPVTHSTTSWGDHDAANLYAYCGLAEVDPASMKRGDLVFYGKDGTVDHVSIYLGDGQVIEAHPKGVRIVNADYRPIMGARRVFG